MGREGIDQAEVGFGRLLRAHRGIAGLTQEELAARAGLSAEAISTLERGSRRAPRAATVECLAGALKLDPAQRAEFAVAAMGWSEPFVPANGAADVPANGSGHVAANGAEEAAVYERASGGQRRSATASLGKRLPLVGGVVVLLCVLGFVAYSALSHVAQSQRPPAPVRKPLITDLSVTPSTLSPSPTNHSVIRFHVNVHSNITVMVTDVDGRIIKKLLDNDPRAAGPTSKPYFGYDGAATLSPGRYIVVVSATANGSTAMAVAPIFIK